jgi:hypothetical protein
VIVPGYQTTASKISQPSSLQREDVQDIIYFFNVGLSDEQTVYMGAMHQHTYMFEHDTTYREHI